MHCPLCGALNEPAATICYLCDTQLNNEAPSSSTIVPTAKRNRILWKWGWVALWTVVIATTIWFLLSDLFTAPSEVEKSRDQFYELSERYHSRKEKWNRYKANVLGQLDASAEAKKRTWIKKIPLEVFAAYLFEDLSFTSAEFDGVSLYPSENSPCLILSKYEYNVWPYRILLSLEIELQAHNGRIDARLKTLRRGTRVIPEALAWVYFGAELQALSNLDAFSQRVTRIKLNPPKDLSLECEPLFIAN